jgi:glycosyltransferase involved in cell wall biosynthesis
MSEALLGPPLRIAVLGDFDGLHTRRWLSVFVARGHDIHAISFYSPREPLEGVTLHVLRDRAATGVVAPSARSGAGLIPASVARFVHAWRYRKAGVREVIESIAPDVLHAHYVVEHGFYGAIGFHPYVASAWGSDLLIESRKPLGRFVARRVLRQADLVAANDPSLARRAIALGVAPERVVVASLGIDALFFEGGQQSVNLLPPDAAPPTVLSDRALEPLYNVDVVLRAFARLRERLPTARLLIAGDGRQRPRLEALAQELQQGESVRFLGRLTPDEIKHALASAHVYVSVPDSDSLSSSTLEAMASGSFPVISDLPSANGAITDRVNGLRVPRRDVSLLTEALTNALTDTALRRDAVATNRALAEAQGQRERNLVVLERLYYRLAGHPVADGEAI